MAGAERAPTEAEKMARVPGIWLADTPSGRTAIVEGTGLGVWEVMKHYEPPTYDRTWLATRWDHLAGWQLDAAIDWYQTFPNDVQAEIDEDLALERALMAQPSWTGQEVGTLLDSLGISRPSARDERRGRWSATEKLTTAAREERCMVTENYRDFSRIAPLWSAQRRPHAGILLIPRSATKEGTEAMVEALARFATENPEGLKPYEVRWLALESR